jgi:hypothetical protein
MAALVLSLTVMAQGTAAVPRQDPAPAPGSSLPDARSSEAAGTAATILGHVWGADGRPVANAALRLRDVTSGRLVGRTVSVDGGQFTFVEATAGTYVVECVDDLGKVLAVGNTFEVAPGETVSTFVRLGSQSSPVSSFFNSIAAVVISSAASVGVTAVGSTGRPVSPNR